MEEQIMTIQEIAALANVSPSTVSKIVNGKDKDISEATRIRVLKVIEENNYVPYARYRKEEHLKRRLVGVILRSSDPFTAELLPAIEKVLAGNDYNLITRFVDGSAEMTAGAVSSMIRLNLSGLMIFSDQDFSEYTDGLNTVYISDRSDFASSQGSTFYLSIYDAGRLAASRLIREGHTQISCITLKNRSSVLYGAEEAIRRHDSLCHMKNWYIGDDLDDIAGALENCINDEVTAVICGSPQITQSVCDYASSVGISIPHTLSVISVGDEPSLKYMSGGITAVSLPLGSLAEKASLYLLDTIASHKNAEVTKAISLSVTERSSICPSSPISGEANILVVGSLNMDTTLELAEIPVNGETQIAGSILTLPGGKGGNQAVGAGKLGGNVFMIGRLGKDHDGRILRKSLTANQVDVEGVEFDSSKTSGKAFIYIDKNGENTIVVYPGANLQLSESQLRRHEALFRKSSFCLLSLEISEKAAEGTIKMCRDNHVQLLLKPSPVDKLNEYMLDGTDYFIPNEHELNKIVPGPMPVEEKAEVLFKKGIRNVIVTLGKRGCYLKNARYSLHFPSAPFTAVDTTGGADSFISALAVCLSQGRELVYSIVYATYAAGITITRYGVPEALPDSKTMNIYRKDIETSYTKITDQETTV